MSFAKFRYVQGLAALAALSAVMFSGPVAADHGGRDFADGDTERTEGSRDSQDERGSHSGRGDDRKIERRGPSSREHETDSKKRTSSDSDAWREDDKGAVAAGRPRVVTEIDPKGHERRSGEILLIGPPQAIEAARAAGYRVIAARQLLAMGETLARIRIDAGLVMEQVIRALHATAPEAYVAPNHVFRLAQAESLRPAAQSGEPDSAASASGSVRHASFEMRPPESGIRGARIGVIDTGADTSSAALAGSVMRTWGLAEGGYTPRAHGTVVAEIAAGQGARLAVADVFGVDANNQLVASADSIAAAIDWLLSEDVTIMNISIEGPDNIVLAHVVQSAIARGATIVAAAGNGGPAAPPVYPAAYPNVIAVTAVDEEDRVYPRANRGDYIAFAARGVRVPVSYGPKGPSLVSGTSFAAPAVASELARRLAEAEHDDPAAVLVSLQHDAVDLGAPGRDPIFGWGRIVARPSLSIASLQNHR